MSIPRLFGILLLLASWCSAQTRIVSGQVFTGSGRDIQKIAEAEITAYPMEMLETVLAQMKTSVRKQALDDGKVVKEAFAKALAKLPALGKATSDGDGNFSVAVPEKTPVFIFVKGVERYRGVAIPRFWAVGATEARVILSDANNWKSWRAK